MLREIIQIWLGEAFWEPNLAETKSTIGEKIDSLHKWLYNKAIVGLKDKFLEVLIQLSLRRALS